MLKLADLHARGIRTIVDLTTVDLGRDIDPIADVARRSPVQIIVATGVWRMPQRADARPQSPRDLRGRGIAVADDKAAGANDKRYLRQYRLGFAATAMLLLAIAVTLPFSLASIVETHPLGPHRGPLPITVGRVNE